MTRRRRASLLFRISRGPGGFGCLGVGLLLVLILGLLIWWVVDHPQFSEFGCNYVPVGNEACVAPRHF